MSGFLDSIVDVGKGLWNSVTGSGMGGTLVSTLLTGLALNQVTKSINKSSNTQASQTQTAQAETGNKITLTPATENRVPVVYGGAMLSGIVTDARMSADNQKMTYCLTICEVTGTKMSDGLASEFLFEDVYANGNRIVFKADGLYEGIEASYMIDPDGNVDKSIDGLIKVYLYKNGSSAPAILDNYTAGPSASAYEFMPYWTSNHTMNNLVFAIVEVTYNKTKNVTSLPNMSFAIQNSMTMPGDCLWDYMTNTRYGAGIPASEIKDA
jgi:hypothetical protein